MGEESFDEVCAYISACLTSSKRQVSVAELNKDYHSILGEYIPYRKCGFKSLEDFVKAVPNVRLSRIGNETFIEAKPDEKTKHITDLVRGQKTAKKKPKGSKYGTYQKFAPSRRPFDNRNSYNSDAHKRHNGGSSFNHFGGDFRNATSTTYNNSPSSNGPSSYNLKKSQMSQPAKKNVSDWDAPTKVDYSSKYKSSRRTDLDFSDGENDDYFDYDDTDYSEELGALSPIRNDEQAVSDKFTNLHVTLQSGRQVSDKIQPSKHRASKLNSQDDDFGYGSMNEVSTPSHRASSEKSHLKMGDPKPRSPKSSSKHTQLVRGPAAIVAAGRAMKEPDQHRQRMNEGAVFGDHDSPRNPRPYVQPTQTHHRIKRNSPIGDHVRRSGSPQLPLGTIDDLYHNDVLEMPSPERIPSPKKDANPFVTNVPKKTKPFSSKMSDPNMFKSGPDDPPNYTENTACSHLLIFTVNHQLPIPQFMNFTKWDQTTHTAQYMCKIKIGEHLNFSSCPFSSDKLSEVQEYVAELALEELSRRFENRDTDFHSSSTNKQQIISRVTEIVVPHPTGLKKEALEKNYKLKYEESLPADWLEVIKMYSLLSVEQLVGGIFVYPPENRPPSPNITKLPPLVLPEEETWPVFVTCCMSTNNLYFRIVMDDYNGVFETMTEQMEEMYSSKGELLTPVDIVKEGNYYAALLNDQWFRVKALSGIVDDIVRVSLIDLGDTDDVKNDVIYPLDEKLTSVPAQAVRGSLAGLEDHYENMYVTQLVCDLTCGNSLQAEVKSRNPNLSLVLFDTSPKESDINLNELLLKRIEMELSPPKIPAKNSITNVNLTSVREDGRVHVQIRSECFKFLRSLMANVNQELSKNESKYTMKSISELVGGTVFLAKYDGDNKWYRASVRSLIDDDKVEVLFIDYGNIEVVPLEYLANTQPFTDVLAFIPPQATEVQLIKPTRELFTQQIIEFLMNCTKQVDEDSLSQRFLMKVVNDNAVPDVELYVRMPHSNELVSINDILGTCYPEYRSPNFKPVILNAENKISEQKTSPKRKGRNSANDESDELLAPVKPFNIPSIGGSLNVHVIMVSNPCHFIVLPVQYHENLKVMAGDMQRFYSREKPAIDVSSIREGQAYAVERPDGAWCRAVITLVMTDQNHVSVKCIDYGDTLSVQYQSLALLLPCFRELPALAIKAELAGIRPMHGDWMMSDCLRFKDLVANKSFVGIIVDAGKDSVNLLLLDTSENQDIDIGGILVAEGRAKDLTLE